MPAYMPNLGLAAVKNVNVHPQNTDLPSVMATVTVIDPETGYPLAIMDGTYLTAMRTGAAGGVAAKYLAREDARVAGFIGAGRQARTQLDALLVTRPGIEKVLVADEDAAHAEAFARDCARQHGREAAVASPEDVVRGSDVLHRHARAQAGGAGRMGAARHAHQRHRRRRRRQAGAGDRRPARATIVVDNWAQASHGGEINVAVARGVLTHQDVYADIGQVVDGPQGRPPQSRRGHGVDSTGLAIQDVACAARVLPPGRRGGGRAGEPHSIDFMA